MKPEDLCLFLTGYTLTVAMAVLAEFLYARRTAAAINSVLALSAVVTTAVAGSFLQPNGSYLDQLSFLVRERDFSAAIAVGMGAAAGVVWFARCFELDGSSVTAAQPRFSSRLLAGTLLVASLVGVVLGSHAFFWKGLLGYKRDVITRMHDDAFIAEKVAERLD